MLGEDAMMTYSHSMENHLIILFSICQWILAIFPRLVPRFFVFIQFISHHPGKEPRHCNNSDKIESPNAKYAPIPFGIGGINFYHAT